MKLLAIVMLSTALSGCMHSKPVTFAHWESCERICYPLRVKEACVSLFKGELCSCYSGGSISDFLDQYRQEDTD